MSAPSIRKPFARSLRVKAGDYYNAEAVEKSVEEASIEIAKRGYPFASVRPRGDRNFEARTINLVFAVEEGARAYIERINIIGNTRTRDYVIRREFDIGEGDAYNRALIDRAERRLKNLNYFKSVKITNEPGSAPDRIVINVNVVEQPTGEFAISGGYSTADGFLGEVSVGERNLLGRGQYARVAVQYGQYAKGFELGFVEPYLLGQRIALGIDIFAKERTANSYQSYDTRTIGGAVRLGFQLREDTSLQLRYSLYEQKITLPEILNDCIYGPFPITPGSTCITNGEASIPVRVELSQGAVLTSMVGYTLSYNTLDNNKNPTRGMVVDFKQDFAGVGGDTNFIRSTVDTRFYSEWIPDIINVIRLQAGHIDGWGGKDRPHAGPLQDGSEPGARICHRRPRTARYHARIYRRCDRRHDVLGREPRIPDPALFHSEGCRPEGRGVRGCRLDLGLQGSDLLSGDRRNDDVRGRQQDAVVGRCRSGLGFTVRPHAVRLFVPDHQGSHTTRCSNSVSAAAPNSDHGRRAVGYSVGMTEPFFFKPKAGMTVGEIAE